jgi:glycosyltransferase involved in cell wall biosynthesis
MTAPRRILHLASFSSMGGTERMILFLVEAMDRTHFENHVCCLIGNGDLIRRAEPVCAGARHFQFRHPLDPRGIADVIRYIRRHRIELVHTYGLRADTVGRVAARLGGARAVVSGIRSIDPWRRWHHTLLDRLTAPLVDLFISNSEAGKAATVARERFAPQRIEVIHSGIPAREIPVARRREIRAELGVAPDAFPVTGILANLREMKGHEDVVRALPAILAAWPSAVFLFAGRDDSGGAIARMAADLGVDRAIRFLGYRADTAPLLAAMDIFMLPSHWEGLPVSILEAMHAGVPVITTGVGGIPELVRDGEEALIIEPRRPDLIAQAVGRLAADEDVRRRLALAAQRRARNEFSLETMVRRHEEVYARLLRM